MTLRLEMEADETRRQDLVHPREAEEPQQAVQGTRRVGGGWVDGWVDGGNTGEGGGEGEGGGAREVAAIWPPSHLPPTICAFGVAACNSKPRALSK